jgi:hypothetical protein
VRRRIATLFLIALLAVTGSAPMYARTKMSPEARAAQKQANKQQKAWMKYAKKQQKAYKKELKKEAKRNKR